MQVFHTKMIALHLCIRSPNMALHVQHFFHQDSSTFSYIVYDAQSLECAVIDPVLDFDYAAGRTSTDSAERISTFIETNSLTLRWIFETHAHADHLSAAQVIKKHHDAPIAIGEGITQVQKHFASVFNLQQTQDVKGADFDRLLADGDQWMLGDYTGIVMRTPGHTNDSVSYIIDGKAFVGDTIFMPDGGTARCDFPGGSAALLYQSVQKLYALGDDTQIYVCHDYQPGGREYAFVASVAEHRQNNIHINDQISEREFIALREARDQTLGMPRLIIPSIQINIKAGMMPIPEENAISYIKVPLNAL